jgi:putative DNA primase/helicase
MSEDPVQLILSRLDGAKQTGPTQWQARCPAHDDQHASLCVGRGADGRALLKCQAGCSSMEVCRALNLPLRALFPPKPDNEQGRIVATYDYRDAGGNVLFQCVRFEPKDFRQRRPDGNGGWIWELGETPRVLYRLPELLAADPAQWVFIVEGEKDVDNLRAAGLVATCNPMGAGKWGKLSDDSALHNRKVAILPDKDKAGRDHARQVAAGLQGKVAELKVLELPGAGKDASDWLGTGGTAQALLALVEDAKPYDPGAQAQEDEVTADPAESLVKLGQHDPRSGRLVLSPKRTLPTATAFVQEFYSHPDSRKLVSYAGLMMAWRDNRFVEIEDESLKNRIQPWLHNALRYVINRKTQEPELVDFESNPATVNSTLDSIRTYSHLPASMTPPAWVVDAPGRPDAREVLPCRTLNLHIPTGRVLSSTPALFTINALDFDYDGDADQPGTWLSFLDQLWGEDQQSKELLQEWFGYCLIPDTSQQKMLLLVGPRRSGKGTIGRVLAHLLGTYNVCGPTTGSLAGPFGLQPLIGKSLAIVSDARFSGENIATVVERLLCISGEDTLTIDRKHLESVTMKLPTRFMFLTNELPRLNDASGALAGRFMVLRLTKGWYGQEDVTLTERLLAELPGILLWALQGWVRLRERGRFVQPTSVEDAIRDLEDLSSPVGAFVRACCKVGPGHRAWVDEMYTAWKKWCEEDGRTTVTTRQTFGRDLAAVVPGMVCRQNRNVNRRFYDGISIE